ncbi:MAG TPA: hypothetical protein VF021_00750 [Longimicrobiales bacterium]
MRAPWPLLLLCLAAPLRAQSTHALIVVGVGGEPRLVQQFQQDGTQLRVALVQRFGASATLLTETSTPRSDKAGIAAALGRLAADTKPGDRALLVFIGHGSAQGDVARINIPGPDLSASELAVLLEQLAGRATTIVLASSASGAFVPVLKGANRTIVSATRSGAENEEVVFPRYFAQAFAQDVADSNKDGGVSIAEAFEYAKREVARFYQQQNRLPTEHAVLSDSAGAQRFVLRSGGAVAADPKLAAIQQRIDALKARKADMPESDYQTELEKLMLELARRTRELRASGQ